MRGVPRRPMDRSLPLAPRLLPPLLPLPRSGLHHLPIGRYPATTCMRGGKVRINHALKIWGDIEGLVDAGITLTNIFLSSSRESAAYNLSLKLLSSSMGNAKLRKSSIFLTLSAESSSPLHAYKSQERITI